MSIYHADVCVCSAAEDTLGNDEDEDEEESQLSSVSPVQDPQASEQTINGAAKQKDAGVSKPGQESKDERMQILR